MTERTEALRRFPPANPQRLVPMTLHAHGPHTCYCPNCDIEVEVETSVKCNTQICPCCGARMRAKETGELRIPGNVSSVSYGPESATRKFMDEMEKLYRSDHEEYQRRKKLIYQAIKERERGKIKTYPDISLTDLRQILHELDMLYG